MTNTTATGKEVISAPEFAGKTSWREVGESTDSRP
jgi:hypothetical protein